MTDNNPSSTPPSGDAALQAQVARRRTFAIISHPDAGKTTLTEHLLLYGGAIHLAGQVKARGDSRRAKSDWLKIEQQRGISVTSAVMTFEFEGITFNLLDTPGHEDFSEDTYRTLTAADSAIMVLDAAKGIEAQTLKLFEVCRLRDVPIITFVNKIDRESRAPFELLDEIASKLALDTCPLMWPMAMGAGLRGIYDLRAETAYPYYAPGKSRGETGPVSLDVAESETEADPEKSAALREEIELAKVGYPEWNLDAYRAGTMTPVFFGSALRNFGVENLLRAVAELAPPPRPQKAQGRMVQPTESEVTGFVFKVQANMDSKHRDRVAFMRLCSGKFSRGMKLTVSSSGKNMAIQNPVLFFAQDRELVDEAYPGDIIGIPNHGTVRVGDALYEKSSVAFAGIPDFAPEILRRIRLDDPMRAKHLQRALENLADEGVSQIFKAMLGGAWVVGVVGQLQLEVLADRLEHEYKVKIDFESVPYETARWVEGDDPLELKKFIERNYDQMVEDRDGKPVFLAQSAWELRYQGEKFPGIRFIQTQERDKGQGKAR